MNDIRIDERVNVLPDYNYFILKGYIETEFLCNSLFYALIYVIAGEAILTVNQSSCNLIEYDYILLRPKDVWKFASSGSSTELIVIYMNNGEMEKFFDLYGQKVKKYIEIDNEINKVTGDFNVKFKVDEIYGRLTKYGDANRVLCRLITTEILTGIVRKMHRQSKADEIPPGFVHALNEMRKSSNLREGVNALERLTRYSRAQLCRLIKKYYNMTPQEYIAEIRLNFAYNMIKFSNMDYESIAEKVGYSSISHFYKKFRARYQTTPAELRKREGIQL